MNRRRFLQLFSVGASAVVAPGELWTPGQKRIFLPPRGGWVSSRPAHRLHLKDLRVDVKYEYDWLYGERSLLPLAIEPRLRMKVKGLLRTPGAVETIEILRSGEPVEVAGLPGHQFRISGALWYANFDSTTSPYTTVELVQVSS